MKEKKIRTSIELNEDQRKAAREFGDGMSLTKTLKHLVLKHLARTGFYTPTEKDRREVGL